MSYVLTIQLIDKLYHISSTCIAIVLSSRADDNENSIKLSMLHKLTQLRLLKLSSVTINTGCKCPTRVHVAKYYFLVLKKNQTFDIIFLLIIKLSVHT